MATKHFTHVLESQLDIQVSLPERSFVSDLRADCKRYLVFQTPQQAGSTYVKERISLESSFIDLYSLSRPDITPTSVVGYCIDVKRGNVVNVSTALIIHKTRLPGPDVGCVNLDITQQIKLLDLLRVFKLGDGAIFMGIVSETNHFFY